MVDDTSVIQMDSSVHNQTDALSGGSTNINGTYTACTFYDTNPDLNCPCIEWNTYTGASVGDVCGFSISSPSANQVYGMTAGNYNQATVPLEADSACSGTTSWTLSLKYTTANGSSYTGSATTSTTIGQSTNYTTPVVEGGQVNAQASATLAGKNLTATVTFYVLGPGGGIPDGTISTRLYGLYAGTTSGLLTGIAKHESNYAQFYDYTEMGLPGLWPQGNRVGTLDTFVGLMQVPNGMANGFDWLTNTYDGWSIFEGKLSTVSSWVSSLQSQHSGLPSLSGSQQEDNALVLYGGYDAIDYPQTYYIWLPNSSYSGWTQNSGSPAYSYVYAPTTDPNPGVRDSIQPE